MKRRRTVTGAPTQQTRPTWAGDSVEGARKGLGAFEEKMVYRLYYRLVKMLSEAGGPLSKNQDWFDTNPEGAIREIVAGLCDVGLASVGGNVKGRREGGRVLRSASPRGHVKKDQREVATQSETPGGETLYDCIVGRISAARRSGGVNAARNLLRYLTIDGDGPKLPGVPYRVSRRKLRQMGLFCEDEEGVYRREIEAVYK